MDDDPREEQSEEVSQAHLNVTRFNESFYRSDPADHLLTKLHLMFLAGSKHDELRDLLEAGGEYAGVTIGARAEATESAEPTLPDVDAERDLDRFIVVESQQLLHHACETALRLFFVHAASSKVPWVELARFRNFGKFKEQVKRTFVDNDPPRGAVSWVCLGSESPTGDTSQATWDDAIDGLIAFFREFAKHFLSDANLYNSIKHGLGVSPGDAVLLVEGQEMGAGPSIEFPESGNWDGDMREWSLTTVWPDIAESLGLSYVAIQIISSMWRIGRYRYLGTDSDQPIYFPDQLRPSDLRGAAHAPLRRMSWKLVEERR